MADNEINIQIPGYKIIRPIGHGGMATVYLAVQESIERQVAIKIMSPALASDPTFSERFVKEARMANLSHANIITVYDAGVADEQNYIVMELAAGGNLDSAIQEGLSAKRIIEIIKQIASALHYSCNKGFIHRDVKPENILFKEDGSALLVDFGIAKAVSSSTRLTMVGSTIGSPNYMSPEQARGLALDGRSDLYALGIVFYEALTGIKPFDASDTYVIGLKHISEPIPQLPEPFTKFQLIIDQLLAKEPDGRFESGATLNIALDKIVLEDIDSTIVPVSDFTYNDTKTHADIDEKETKISPEFGERETLVVDAAVDPTQIISQKTKLNDDRTKLLPNDETRLMSAKASVVTLDKKSSNGFVWVVVIIVLIGGFFGWKYTDVPSNDVAPPIVIEEPVIEKNKGEEVVESISDTADVVEAPVAPVVDDRIESYLKKADSYFVKKQLTTPKNKNAFFMYGKVLELDSDNVQALTGIDKIADEYYRFAEKKFNKKQYNKAQNFVDKGLDIVTTHQKLLDLQDRIDAALQPKPEIAAKTIKIEKNSAVLDLVGRHIATSSAEVERSAKRNLNDKIYFLGLKQCNDNEKLFASRECEALYKNLIRQWPISIKSDAYAEAERNKLKHGKFVFNKQKAIQAYKISDLNSASDFSNKEIKLDVANRIMSLPVTSLLGIKQESNLLDMWDEVNLSSAKNRKSIAKKSKLINRINVMLEGKAVFIKPFVSKNSFEITPFASALYQTLRDEVSSTDVAGASYQLRGELALIKNGNVTLNLWLFNQFNEMIDLETYVLDKAMFENYRVSKLFFNDTIFPTSPLEYSYGFPADIKIGNYSSNALLLVGDETSLSVKLDNPGFFYIAVHVVRENEQFSYLLPLQQSKVPFVQVALRKQRFTYASLGKFDITPPTGVETLQLIASSINLEKYLPPYTWSEKRQQFIINGSEGSIENGISAVRRVSNRIHQTAHDKSVQWQERLLVTTILEKQKL